VGAGVGAAVVAGVVVFGDVRGGGRQPRTTRGGVAGVLVTVLVALSVGVPAAVAVAVLVALAVAGGAADTVVTAGGTVTTTGMGTGAGTAVCCASPLPENAANRMPPRTSTAPPATQGTQDRFCGASAPEMEVGEGPVDSGASGERIDPDCDTDDAANIAEYDPECIPRAPLPAIPSRGAFGSSVCAILARTVSAKGAWMASSTSPASSATLCVRSIGARAKHFITAASSAGVISLRLATSEGGG
jgi:hypothetical protein